MLALRVSNRLIFCRHTDFNECFLSRLQGDVIVVCGVSHVTFYSLEGNNLTKRSGVMGSKGSLSKMMCIAWANNDAVIGTSTGKLYRFKEHQLQSVRGN